MILQSARSARRKRWGRISNPAPPKTKAQGNTQTPKQQRQDERQPVDPYLINIQKNLPPCAMHPWSRFRPLHPPAGLACCVLADKSREIRRRITFQRYAARALKAEGQPEPRARPAQMPA